MIEFGVSFSVSAVWEKQKCFLPHPLVKLSIVGSIRDREVARSASNLRGVNFEFCVWREVSSHSSHHPQGVLLAQYVHESGLKPDSFNFLWKRFPQGQENVHNLLMTLTQMMGAYHDVGAMLLILRNPFYRPD